MQVAELVREYLATILVWPVALIVAVALLRKSIRRLLDGPLTRLLDRVKRIEAAGFGIDAALDELEKTVEESEPKKRDKAATPVETPARTNEDVPTSAGQLPMPTPLPDLTPDLDRAASSLRNFIATRATSWSEEVTRLAGYATQEPRHMMLLAFGALQSRLEQDRNDARNGWPTQGVGHIIRFKDIYPLQWEISKRSARRIFDALDEDDDITLEAAISYLNSIDRLYRQHLDYLIDALFSSVREAAQSGGQGES